MKHSTRWFSAWGWILLGGLPHSLATPPAAPGKIPDVSQTKTGEANTDPGAAQRWHPRTSRETIQRLKRISASTQFGHCCFLAWELELALLKKDREVAQQIAT